MQAAQQVLSKPIKIGLEKDSKLPDVEHDSDQIHQVLLNLLLNAVQAIDGAGTIRVEISTLKGDAAIVVIDTGSWYCPRTSAQHLSSVLYDEGIRHGSGTSLVRRIAEEHRGRIEVAANSEKAQHSW